MKRWLFVFAMVFFISGCGTITERSERSEFLKHDAMYASFDHLGFSWTGYNHPDEESLRKTREQNWWGIPIEK